MSEASGNYAFDYDLVLEDEELEELRQEEDAKRRPELSRSAQKRPRVGKLGSSADPDAMEAARRVDAAVATLLPVNLVYYTGAGENDRFGDVDVLTPQDHGTRALPTGHPYCFARKSFIISGTLPTLTHDEAEALIVKHGGRMAEHITQYVHFLLAGRYASKSKCDKAIDDGVFIIDQDGLFQLIKAGDVSDLKPGLSPRRPVKASSFLPSQICSDPSPILEGQELGKRLWIDKHSPKTVNDIIANRTVVLNLTNWIGNWQARHTAQKLVISVRGQLSTATEVKYKKALLFSGPPGSGKTRLVKLVCEDLGIKAIVTTSLEDRSPGARSGRDGVAGIACNRQHAVCQNWLIPQGTDVLEKPGVLVVDEIESLPYEPGALAALIESIKVSSIPVICIGTDVRSPLLSPLKPFCTELEMRQLKRTSLMNPLITVCRSEGLHVCNTAMNALVGQAAGDVRVIINTLQGIPSVTRVVGIKQTRTGEVAVRKGRDYFAFETTRILFGADDRERSWEEREQMVSKELDFIPYFIQENYINQCPVSATNEKERLKSVAKAARLLSFAERLNTAIEMEDKDELTPSAIALGLIAPTAIMRGHREAFLKHEYNTIRFGMYYYEKFMEAEAAMRGVESAATRIRWAWKTSVSDEAVRLDYFPALGALTTCPLMYSESSGHSFVLDLINNYQWNREHYETLLELIEPWNAPPRSEHSVTQQYIRGRRVAKRFMSSRVLLCPVDGAPAVLTDLEDLLTRPSILKRDSCVIKDDKAPELIEELDPEEAAEKLSMSGYTVKLHGPKALEKQASSRMKSSQASRDHKNDTPEQSIYKIPHRHSEIAR